MEFPARDRRNQFIMFWQGGMKAVVWTDVVQGVVMMLSMVLVISFGLQKIGGIATAWDRAVDGGRVFAPEWVVTNVEKETEIKFLFFDTRQFLFSGFDNKKYNL